MSEQIEGAGPIWPGEAAAVIQVAGARSGRAETDRYIWRGEYIGEAAEFGETLYLYRIPRELVEQQIARYASGLLWAKEVTEDRSFT